LLLPSAIPQGWSCPVARASGWQTPPLQGWPWQSLPQTPQFRGSLVGSVQPVAQAVSSHVHAPPSQSGEGCAQSVSVCHAPVLSQTWGVVGPLQRACPGTHPVMHCPSSHASAHVVVCKTPALSQTSTPVPLDVHWDVPGTHVPAHAPLMHVYGHWLENCQTPPAVQVSTAVPLHCVVFGAHAPEQTPASHRYEQTWSGIHSPTTLHSSALRPWHWRAPGEQGLQAPARQTGFAPPQGAPAFCQWPSTHV
jgi:hypothetical protein